LALEKPERKKFYYAVRDEYMFKPQYKSRTEELATLYFLLRTAWNGLYRTGKAVPGRFNTPCGFLNEKGDFYHKQNVKNVSKLFKNNDWIFLDGDFTQTLEWVTEDSFVFLDPPYRNTYNNYTDDGFNDNDQLRVIEYFKAADAKGATIVLTNTELDDGFWETHLNNFKIDYNHIRHMVNADCASKGRPLVKEVMIHNS